MKMTLMGPIPVCSGQRADCDFASPLTGRSAGTLDPGGPSRGGTRLGPGAASPESARPRLNLLFALVMLVAAFPSTSFAAGREIEFNRDVRPILSDKCFACHGPDAGARQADLRLDLRDDVIADRGGYQAVQPGKPDDSELVARITAEDEDERMPPEDFGKSLTDGERRVLIDWIRQGAAWQQHWSLIPPRRPAVPVVQDSDWAVNPVDRFILARLEREGIRPSPPADSRTLVRRVFFDVTGLPPAPADVTAFEQARSRDAYESLVDRLLASPHYGERMAMYWLDLVRYADTLGYHGDQPRSVSPYRDYVISAFNSNMPFDQFTVENLAGDLLPDATLSQKVASTYNRLNRASAEGGVQPKEYLAKYAADRVRTAGGVWLGSTFGCAECHDHKFDPFTTRDFYSFAAFFADVREQGIVPGAVHIEQLPVPTPQQEATIKRLDAEVAATEKELGGNTPEMMEKFAAWESQMAQRSRRWTVLHPASAESANGAKLEIKEDGAVIATGKNPDKDTYTVTATWSGDAVTAIRLEALDDARLPAGGPGRAGNGNFVVQQFQLSVNGRPVAWKSAAASHSQDGFGVQNLVQGKKGWAILPQAGKTLQALFVAKESTPPQDKPLDAGEQDARLSDAATPGSTTTLKFVIAQNHGAQHTLGRFRLYATSIPNLDPQTEVKSGVMLPGPVADDLAIKPNDRTPEQSRRLKDYFRRTAPALEPLRNRLATLKAEREKVQKSIITTLATAAGKPRVMRVLPRGNWMDDSGDIVQPAVPHFLTVATSSNRRLDRRDLAHWLTSRENPLVARVFVNRLWMLFFGQGIAPSVDDLGSQGQWPSHPKLLDWLAVEFLDSGWDVKHMVRLLVTSNTYQQSSAARPDLQRSDPLNQLVARQDRWRIDAEMVRDNALAASGLLVRTIGGPSVKPYQPAGYWAQLNFPKRTYQHDKGPNQYRRGLYTHWQRTFLHPSLLAFDAPVREECTARRERSNTPLQALVLLNDPTYVEAARVLATRTVREGGDSVDSRLEWLFQQVLDRKPTPTELKRLTEFHGWNLQIYRNHAEDAAKLIRSGLAPVPDDLDPAVLAAWTCIARVMFNLHETITRY